MSPSYLIADALPGHVDGRAHDGGIGGSLGGLGNIGHTERRDSRCPGIDGAGEAAASRRDATCTEFGKNKNGTMRRGVREGSCMHGQATRQQSVSAFVQSIEPVAHNSESFLERPMMSSPRGRPRGLRLLGRLAPSKHAHK